MLFEKYIKPNLFFLLALVYLIFCGGLPSGLAFCLGSDGHIAFEAIDATGDCALGAENNHPADSQHSQYKNTRHCDICFDVVPIIGKSTTAFKPNKVHFFYPVLPFISEGHYNKYIILNTLFSSASFPSTSYLISLRTTILLI